MIQNDYNRRDGNRRNGRRNHFHQQVEAKNTSELRSNIAKMKGRVERFGRGTQEVAEGEEVDETTERMQNGQKR